MGYINIITYSAQNISIKNKQLLLENGQDFVTYPLEDINSLLIESERCSISTNTLRQLAQNNIVTYFCDEKHLPCAYLINYNGFYKNLEVYNHQVNLSKPTQKNLWKQIIVAKVQNQIEVLNLCGIKNDLQSFVPKIKSADSDNIEALVANKYFKLLFGDDFVRRNPNFVNGCLNYAYAIVRGMIARTVVAHGMLPFLGVFHKNKLNAFNLVDDLNEPFRPIVDLLVAKQIDLTQTELTPKTKQQVFSVVNFDMLVNGQKQTVSNCIEILVNSYSQSLSKDDAKLVCPKIIELSLHQYE